MSISNAAEQYKTNQLKFKEISMDKGLLAIIIIAYSAWAIYSGYKFLTGRSPWLDQKALKNRIVKVLLSIVVGYFIGAFYLIIVIFKIVARVVRGI